MIFRAKSRTGIFSFTPDIHRNTKYPTTVTLKGFDSHHHASRFAAMGKPTWDSVRTTLSASAAGTTSGVLVFAPSTSQAQTTAIDMVTHALASPDGAELLLHKHGGHNGGKDGGSTTNDAMELDADADDDDDDDDIQRLDNERAQYLGGDDTLYELMQVTFSFFSFFPFFLILKDFCRFLTDFAK